MTQKRPLTKLLHRGGCGHSFACASSASLGLTDYSQEEMLRLRYKTVNVRAGQNVTSPHLETKDYSKVDIPGFRYEFVNLPLPRGRNWRPSSGGSTRNRLQGTGHGSPFRIVPESHVPCPDTRAKWFPVAF